MLQLKEQESTSAQKGLLYASIEQKTLEIKPVAFKSAIDLSKNRQYLKYALPPFLLFLGFIFMAPNILKDSTYRIMNSDTNSIGKLEQIISLHVKIATENTDGLAALNLDWMHLENKLDYYLKLRNDYEANYLKIIEDGIVNNDMKCTPKQSPITKDINKII